MKKILLTFILIFISAVSVSAKAITGTSVYPFSTENPTETFLVKAETDFNINPLTTVHEGEYLYGKVTKVSNGERGKRQGYFVFNPTHLANIQGNVKELNDEQLQIKVSFYKPFDKKKFAKELGENGTIFTLGKILNIPMLSQGISFIEGVSKPDEESSNRITSGLKKVYKDSPLSYIEKGSPLIIQAGQEVELDIIND